MFKTVIFLFLITGVISSIDENSVEDITKPDEINDGLDKAPLSSENDIPNGQIPKDSSPTTANTQQKTKNLNPKLNQEQIDMLAEKVIRIHGVQLDSTEDDNMKNIQDLRKVVANVEKNLNEKLKLSQAYIKQKENTESTASKDDVATNNIVSGVDSPNDIVEDQNDQDSSDTKDHETANEIVEEENEELDVKITKDAETSIPVAQNESKQVTTENLEDQDVETDSDTKKSFEADDNTDSVEETSRSTQSDEDEHLIKTPESVANIESSNNSDVRESDDATETIQAEGTPAKPVIIEEDSDSGNNSEDVRESDDATENIQADETPTESVIIDTENETSDGLKENEKDDEVEDENNDEDKPEVKVEATEENNAESVEGIQNLGDCSSDAECSQDNRKTHIYSEDYNSKEFNKEELESKIEDSQLQRLIKYMTSFLN